MRAIREHIPNITHIFLRYWGAWMLIIASTMVAETVASRSPKSEFAIRAYKELVETKVVFGKMKKHPAVHAVLVCITLLIA